MRATKTKCAIVMAWAQIDVPTKPEGCLKQRVPTFKTLLEIVLHTCNFLLTGHIHQQGGSPDFQIGLKLGEDSQRLLFCRLTVVQGRRWDRNSLLFVVKRTRYRFH